MKAINLRTEYLEHPLGIDIEKPRFFWNCEGCLSQSAYQIIVKRNGEVIWNSGKVFSNRMNGIRYEGKPLNSRDILEWSLTLFDENGEPAEEAHSFFEMGLLHEEDWQAEWIKGRYKADPKKRYPADCFRKTFRIEDVRKARLYASAKGVYDFFINGKRIEEFILAPGITDYRKRIQYQTYDVTQYLRPGDNRIEFRLADGWYRGSCAAYGVTNVYGKETSLIAQLEIETSRGIKQICTDSSFEWSDDGEIRFADLKDGEIIDANRTPSYRGSALVCRKKGNLVSSNNVYVKEKETFEAKLVKKQGDKYIFDFSQNIAGYIAFDIEAKKNKRIRITCAEILDKNNDITLSNIQETKPAKGWTQMSLIRKLMGKDIGPDTVNTPLQQILYTCKEGRNVYKTSFAVFGFRYIEVISNIPVKAEDFKAVAVYSDMDETGEFECSDELLNQFVKNVRWSMKSNFLDIPTDCPTRERLGWTGDAQIFFNSASYFMNTAPFFAKWLRDMENNQYKNGAISAVIPYEGAEMMYKATGTSAGWADAVYLIPYRYYQKYNDIEILKQNMPMIRKFADYLFGHTGLKDRKEAKKNPDSEYLYEKGIHLGEWLEPEEFRDAVYGASARHPEEATAYFCLAMETIGDIARLLGDAQLQKKCLKYTERSKKAYRNLILKDGSLDTDRQAKLVRPLALGLLEGGEKENAQRRLKQAVENYHCRVGTGFLSTPFLLPVLCEAGETDLAYRVMLNREKPGWLSEVKAGATTVWENWEGDLSQNHYSPGAAAEWLFADVLGIRIAENNTFVLKPLLNDSLQFARGHYDSIYGRVEVRWETEADTFVLHVSVPANTRAELILPDRNEELLKAGTYSFRVSKEQNSSRGKDTN